MIPVHPVYMLPVMIVEQVTITEASLEVTMSNLLINTGGLSELMVTALLE